MTTLPLQKRTILKIASYDHLGGESRIAHNLYAKYKTLGHDVHLFVGHKIGMDADIMPIKESFDARSWAFKDQYRNRFGWKDLAFIKLQNKRSLRRAYHLMRKVKSQFGLEKFDYPESKAILARTPPPELIHCHNLHGEYFDLRLLSKWSQHFPVILTLHDAWLLSGHCAHSFDCERWKSGCGQCPGLWIPPAIKRDGTSWNWKTKKKIYQKSRLYISTPCQWLLDKVNDSILQPGIIEAKVIHNGVDLDLYRPGDQSASRRKLGLPDRAKIILIVGNSIVTSPWKDFPTLKKAMSLLPKESASEYVLVAVGQHSTEQPWAENLRVFPYVQDNQTMVDFYRAADLYVHSARAETFPNVILEALACGTPVIASAIGGIPEQIKGYAHSQLAALKENRYDKEEATGILVPPENPEELGKAINFLITRPDLIGQFSRNCRQDVEIRFSLDRQAQEFLSWYEDILRTNSSSIANT